MLEIREGYARARMTVGEHHLNGGDFCQGGAIFTLADLAFAAAVNSHLVLTVSTSSNITFFRSVPLGTTVYAEAQELVNHPRMPTPRSASPTKKAVSSPSSPPAATASRTDP